MCISLQHLCRSATISSGGEMYGRLGINMMFNSKLCIGLSYTSEY